VDAAETPPVGRIGLLFTDIERSTALARFLGDRWPAVQARHHAILRSVIMVNGGWVDGVEGDAFFGTFSHVAAALEAAVAAQRALRAESWPADVGEVRVRMGLHCGEVVRTETGYVGLDIHLTARVAAAAHGGQLLVTKAIRAAIPDALMDDLGLHRLRDFPAPEQLYCVVIDGRGADEFPPPRTLDVRPTNLPTVKALVGRSEDLKRLTEAVEGDSGRIVTLTGRGGCGKTCLALAVGQELLGRFSGGVWWVPLATRTDAREVLPAVAAAVHADTAGRLPVMEALVARLESAPTLIILDNMEQLLDAAADLAALLDSLPTLHVLVTAQAPLRLPYEFVYPLGTLDAESAMQLFVERGRRAVPHFELDDAGTATARDLCRRVDGLPLAIELAAARLSVLTIAELASRLADSFELLTGQRRGDLARHQSLAATIDWTLANLDDESRGLFVHLGIFALAASLRDIETVLGAGTTSVVDSLNTLVDFALVQRVEEGDSVLRFGMPEAVRQIAEAELGAAADADRWRRRHAHHVLAVLDRGRGLIMATAADHREANRIDADLDRALEWARRNEPELAVRLAATWSLILADLGRVREAQPYAQFVLDTDAVTPQVRAQALFASGIMAMSRGDLELALAHGERALELAESSPQLHTLFLAMLAGLRSFTGDSSRAIRDVMTAVERARWMGDAAWAGALAFETQVRLLAGDAAGALAPHRLSLELGTRSDGWAAQIIDTQRGDLALAFGDFAGALRWYLRSLDFAVPRRDVAQVFFDLCSIADCLRFLGMFEQAAHVVGMARAQSAEMYGSETFADETLARDGTLAALQGALSASAFSAAETAGRTLEPGRRHRRAHELSHAPPGLTDRANS